MKTNKLPFIRWYASDFLTGIRGLKSYQIGIYTVLLNEMYERCSPLPINIDKLSWQCGCTKPVFVKTLSMLKAEGKIIIKDGGLWNDRVEIEFNYRQNKISAAKTGANARWKKPNENKDVPIEPQCGDDAVAMLSQKPESIEKDISKDIPQKPEEKSKGKSIAKRKSIRQFIRENLKGSDDLPDDFRTYAQKWGHPEPDLEWEMFVNTWLGLGDVKADWLATWRNRVTASKKAGWYTSSKPQNKYQQPDRHLASRTAHGVGLRKAISMDDM